MDKQIKKQWQSYRNELIVCIDENQKVINHSLDMIAILKKKIAINKKQIDSYKISLKSANSILGNDTI